MARAPSVTYDDFTAAAAEIEATGQRLTFASVRSKVGGSYDVIKRYLQRWDEDKALRIQAGKVPDVLVGGMQALFDQARAAALAQVRAELFRDAEVLASERAEFEEERDELRRRVAAAEGRAEERKDQVGDLARALDVARRDLALVGAERDTAQQQRVAEANAAALASARTTESVMQQATEFAKHLQAAQADARDARHQLLSFKDELREALKRVDVLGQDLGEARNLIALSQRIADAQHTEQLASVAEVEKRISKLAVQVPPTSPRARPRHRPCRGTRLTKGAAR